MLATMERVGRDIQAGTHIWRARQRKPDQPTFDEWFSNRVKNWKGPPPGRDDDLVAAEEWFRCKGLRGLSRSARGRLAPESWTTSGPNGRKAATFKK